MIGTLTTAFSAAPLVRRLLVTTAALGAALALGGAITDAPSAPVHTAACQPSSTVIGWDTSVIGWDDSCRPRATAGA